VHAAPRDRGAPHAWDLTRDGHNRTSPTCMLPAAHAALARCHMLFSATPSASTRGTRPQCGSVQGKPRAVEHHHPSHSWHGVLSTATRARCSDAVSQVDMWRAPAPTRVQLARRTRFSASHTPSLQAPTGFPHTAQPLPSAVAWEAPRPPRTPAPRRDALLPARLVVATSTATQPSVLRLRTRIGRAVVRHVRRAPNPLGSPTPPPPAC